MQPICLWVSRRFWIWAGICYNLCVVLVLTALVGLSLTFLSPPKARPTTPADDVAMRNKVHQEAVKRSRTTRRLKVTLSPDVDYRRISAPVCMPTLAPTKGGPHNALLQCHGGCHDAFANKSDMCSKVHQQAAMRSRTFCRLNGNDHGVMLFYSSYMSDLGLARASGIAGLHRFLPA